MFLPTAVDCWLLYTLDVASVRFDKKRLHITYLSCHTYGSPRPFGIDIVEGPQPFATFEVRHSCVTLHALHPSAVVLVVIGFEGFFLLAGKSQWEYVDYHIGTCTYDTRLRPDVAVGTFDTVTVFFLGVCRFHGPISLPGSIPLLYRRDNGCPRRIDHTQAKPAAWI